MTAEAMASMFQFYAEIDEIINFAVVSDDKAAARGMHRLSAVFRKIEDREPAMGEPHANGGVRPQPTSIGTPMRERVAHRGQAALGCQQPLAQYSRNPAHL